MRPRWRDALTTTVNWLTVFAEIRHFVMTITPADACEQAGLGPPQGWLIDTIQTRRKQHRHDTGRCSLLVLALRMTGRHPFLATSSCSDDRSGHELATRPSHAEGVLIKEWSNEQDDRFLRTQRRRSGHRLRGRMGNSDTQARVAGPQIDPLTMMTAQNNATEHFADYPSCSIERISFRISPGPRGPGFSLAGPRLYQHSVMRVMRAAGRSSALDNVVVCDLTKALPPFQWSRSESAADCDSERSDCRRSGHPRIHHRRRESRSSSGPTATSNHWNDSP